MSGTPPRTPSLLPACALGAGVGLAAALLQWWLQPLFANRMPFVLFLPALLFAAALLGRVAACVVFGMGLAYAIFLVPPLGVAHGHWQDFARLLLLGAVGMLVAIYGGHLRITTRRAALAEKRLALAQDDTGVGVFELDFEAGTAYVSPGLSQMLGQPVTAGPISLEQWFGALHPDHVASARRAIQERLNRGEMHYEREQEIELPTGKKAWILNRVHLDATAEGVLTHARGASVDITARKCVEDALQSAQANLQQQLEDLQSLHTFTQGIVAGGDSLTPTLRSLLHFMTDVCAAGHGVVSLRDRRDDSTSVVAQVGFPDGALPTALPRPPAEGRVSPHTSYAAMVEAHRAWGEQHGLVDMTSTPLLSSSGDVMGAISVMFQTAQSLSERQVRLCEVCATTVAAVVEGKRARAEVANTEQRFSIALDSSIVPFTILAPVRDGGGRIVDFAWSYLNPAAARALGRDPRDLLGKQIGKALPLAWEPDGQFDRYVAVIETGEPAEFEVRTRASNQGERWYKVVASEVHGSAAVWFANITDHKLNEEALQAGARRKDEFLATLAHELRNPLGVIRQGVAIARAGASAEPQKRWGHAMIDRQVTHMSVLLDDLLDVARVGRGTLLLRKSPERLSDVVNAALESARPHIDAKRHHLEVSLPHGPLTLDVDLVRMTQVIGNLLVNAAKYTDHGGRIQLVAELDTAGVAIRVRDNGMGLTPVQITEIFGMFAQIPSALDKSQGGLGIGLALARGLVELHGGTLSVSSAGPGRGAEFTVRLPESCVHRGQTPVQPATARVGGALHVAPPGTILIADDNRDAADSLAELLRLDGHEVHVAYDGEAALGAFAQVAPEAALLDMDMPRMSGIELARAIRQLPRGLGTTLIAVTGYGQEEDRQRALRAGFDHHVVKPVDPDQIQALVGSGRRNG